MYKEIDSNKVRLKYFRQKSPDLPTMLYRQLNLIFRNNTIMALHKRENTHICNTGKVKWDISATVVQSVCL